LDFDPDQKDKELMDVIQENVVIINKKLKKMEIIGIELNKLDSSHLKNNDSIDL
jgi:hypothetical protein